MYALCIGGPLDGMKRAATEHEFHGSWSRNVVTKEIANYADKYTLQVISFNSEPAIHLYIHESLTPSAAVMKVFTYYQRKASHDGQ